MSLYSVLSIITAIMICAAAWNLLDLAKNIYRKNFKGSGKKTFQEKTVVSEPYQQNFFLRKLFVGYYLAKATFENTKDQAALKENEMKAVKLLRKYAKAQEIYKKHYGYYAGDASELIIEENGKYTIIDPHIKVLNASYTKENPANGYFYVELIKKGSEGHASSFLLSAVPAQYGISGLNTLCVLYINNQVKLLKKNNGGNPVFDISSIDSSWETL
ncbi:MAG: hypothetical protein V1739_04325 [Candidatus Omnitrophota bacterium]